MPVKLQFWNLRIFQNGIFQIFVHWPVKINILKSQSPLLMCMLLGNYKFSGAKPDEFWKICHVLWVFIKFFCENLNFLKFEFFNAGNIWISFEHDSIHPYTFKNISVKFIKIRFFYQGLLVFNLLSVINNNIYVTLLDNFKILNRFEVIFAAFHPNNFSIWTKSLKRPFFIRIYKVLNS